MARAQCLHTWPWARINHDVHNLSCRPYAHSWSYTYAGTHAACTRLLGIVLKGLRWLLECVIDYHSIRASAEQPNERTRASRRGGLTHTGNSARCWIFNIYVSDLHSLAKENNRVPSVHLQTTWHFTTLTSSAEHASKTVCAALNIINDELVDLGLPIN